jgi:O-antigen ligase
MQDLSRRTMSSDAFWSTATILGMGGACLLIAVALVTGSQNVVVAGTMAVLACAVVAWRPYVGILLFLTLMYWRPELYAPGVAEMRLPLVLSVLTLFAWLVQVLVKREKFTWRPELGWLIAFTGTMLLSALQVPGTKAVEECILDVLRLGLLVLVLQQLLTTEARAHWVLQLLMGLTVIISLYAIYGWVTETTVLDEHGIKRAIVAVGDFDDPNDLSAALVIAVPLALLMLIRARSFGGKLWGLACFGVLVTGIYLCDSRGGMLALGVAVGVFLVFQLGWKRGLVLGIAALTVMAFFGPDRFKSETLNGDDSTMGRIQAWDAGLAMFQKSPLLGVGYDQFEKRHPIPAHNTLVHALAECGLLNALAWVGLNYWALLTLIRLHRAEYAGKVSPVWRGYPAALCAGLVASLTAGMFLSHTYRPIPLIPIALAAALGAIACQKTDKRDWMHVLLAAALTVVLTGIVYTAVVVML